MKKWPNFIQSHLDTLTHRSKLCSGLFVLAFVITVAQPCSALEVTPFFGSLNHSSLNGCCISTGPEVGVGLLTRIDVDSLGGIELYSYTDQRWTEFSILRPVPLFGDSLQQDPTHDEDIIVRRRSKLNFTFSYGAGLFNHSTRTKTYDLPALSSGLSLITLTNMKYNLTKNMSISGIFQFSVSIGQDDKGLLNGLFLGLNYDF